jgi:hypothetical protein
LTDRERRIEQEDAKVGDVEREGWNGPAEIAIYPKEEARRRLMESGPREWEKS